MPDFSSLFNTSGASPAPVSRLRALKSPPNAHRYTRREVELIVEYLCEP